MSSRTQFTLAILCLLSSAVASAALITQRGVALNPSNGKVYAIDQAANSIFVIDSSSNQSIRIPVGRSPDAIAVNRSTGSVYVANSADGTVSVLNGETDKVIATVKAGPHPYILAVNEASNKVYVTNTFSDLVAVIDGSNNSSTFLKIGSADNIVVDSQRNLIYLIGYEDPNIRVLNGATNKVEKKPATEHLWGMGMNSTTGALYVTGSGNNEVMGISVGSIPCAVAVNDKTNRVYVVNYGDDSVSVIDAASKNIIATIKVGAGPQALSVDSDRNLIYVANTHGNSVSVLDGQNNALIATVPAGQHPFAITHGPKARIAYVANLTGPAFTMVQLQ